MRTRKCRAVRRNQLIYMSHRHADLSQELRNAYLYGIFPSNTAENDHATDSSRYALEAALGGHIGRITLHHVMTEAGYKELKEKADKWDMVQWAIDTKTRFIATTTVTVYLSCFDMGRLEQLYKEAHNAKNNNQV